jgi:hypothetical protein
MPEASPSDIEQVRYAFRLGWVIAELRGRYRPDRFGKREPGQRSPATARRPGRPRPKDSIQDRLFRQCNRTGT